ncbi:hypothetical protein L1987_61031 [Smallanthus sonchifolius]|uniref:Uncharacterized protein n=1 Tax=Smallanthus sonchifolius TaxID=185202 RepID=A0ACB9D9P6_9ASTR|nr:hypothetical protein L1987_61031 [Smallanthus sonchifolius]
MVVTSPLNGHLEYAVMNNIGLAGIQVVKIPLKIENKLLNNLSKLSPPEIALMVLFYHSGVVFVLSRQKAPEVNLHDQKVRTPGSGTQPIAAAPPAPSNPPTADS